MAQSSYPIPNITRVWFRADADHWKSLTSSLPNPQVITVTLTATDPGGLSASVRGDFVIEWGFYPEVVRARADGAAIELTFDLAVESDPAPKPSQFTVNVVDEDGSAGTVEVNSVAVNGQVMTLDLASALDESQTVTLDYAYNYFDDTPLQRAGGGDTAPSFTGQAVAGMPPPGEPQNFAVSAEAGSLDISATWDELDGADTYKLRWRQSGGEFEAANAATVTDANATITVSDYGEWEVRLQGCNDAGCGPEVSRTVELNPLGQPENLAVSATPGQLSLMITWDPVEGESSYQLRWRLADGEFEAANTITVSSYLAVITLSDYGQWEVRLQACNDAGCGPEASRTVDVVEELQLNLTPSQDNEGNPQRKTITATWNPVPNAASYMLRWWQDEEDPPAPTPHGASRQRSADGSGGPGANRLHLPAGQTSADFTVPGDGEYRAELQARGGGNKLIAQGDNGVNPAADRTDTTPPRVVRGEIDRGTMTIYFDEPLDQYSVGGAFLVSLQFSSGKWFFIGATGEMEISGLTVKVGLGPGHNRQTKPGLLGNKFYYLRPGHNAKGIRDLAGNRAWSTPSIALDNVTKPTSVTGVAVSSHAGADRLYVEGDIIRVTLTFSEAVDVTGTPRVKIDLDPAAGGERWADYVSGSGTEMLDFEYTVTDGDFSTTGVAVLQNTLELNGGAVRSASAIPEENARLAHPGLDHDPFHRVVIPTAHPPLLESAVVNGATLTLTFSEPLGAAASLANDAFTVKKTPQGGTEGPVDLSGSPTIDGDTVTLTLTTAVLDTDTGVKVSYEKPGSGANNKLIDVAGNETASFSDAPVPNMLDVVPEVEEVMISSTPAEHGAYALGETIEMTVTFSDAVDVTGAPRLKIKLDPNYGEKWANYAGGSGTASLTFTYTVAERDFSNAGIAVLGDSLDLNGGAIRLAAKQKDARLRYSGLDHDPNHKVDWRRSRPGVPRVTGVAVKSDPGDGDTYILGEIIEVTVMFSEAVTVTGTPRLKIAMDPGWGQKWLFYPGGTAGEKWAYYADGTGTAELTFAYTVANPNRSTRGVTVLGNSLELNGGAIRSTATTVDVGLWHTGLDHDLNHKVDGVTPSRLAVNVYGTTLTLIYDEAMDEDSLPPASAFTVQRTPQGATEEMVALSGSPAIRGGAVILTLADPVLDTDTDVKVSYEKPIAGAANRLMDKAGNEAAGFTDQEAEPTDTTAPRLLRAEIDGDTLTLYFSEALDEDSIGGIFRVNLWYDGCSPICHGPFTAAGEVEINGSIVAVGLGGGRRARAGDGGTTVYASPLDPTGKRLRDLAGNEVKTPRLYVDGYRGTLHTYLENLTLPPSLEGATVNRDRLTLTFDEDLNENSVPAASAFTVKVGQDQVSLVNAEPVTVAGSIVTLTLISAVAEGDVVEVSYSKPPRKPLRNRNDGGGDVTNFSDESVANLTGVVPAVANVAVSTDPGPDLTYALGEEIRVQLTFNEPVDVTGTPRLKIRMDPGSGEQWAEYATGSGTATLSFAYEVVEPNRSTQGIAVLANTLELNGGTIRSSAAQTDARLGHAGLGHNPDHKVDWQQGAPVVTGVAISSDPGDDDTYSLGDTIRVTLTFSNAADVVTTGGNPRLKIKLAPDSGEKWADYSGGSGTTTLTFDYTVAEGDISTDGVAVLGDTLALNGGAVRSTATQRDALLKHAGLDHNTDHLVDWQLREPGAPLVTGVAITSNPGDDDTYALGENIQVTATFSEAVDVDTTGGTPRLRIRMAPLFWGEDTDSEERWADYSGGSGTAELTFDYTVVAENRSVQGVAVLKNALDFNGGAIRSATAPPVNAHLHYEGRWHDLNHLVDGKAPSLLGVAVAGTTVSLTYDEALDMDSIPPASAFTVKRTPQSGTEEEVALTGPPVIAAGAALLTLDEPVLATDTGVTVSYDQTAGGGRRQAAGPGRQRGGQPHQPAGRPDRHHAAAVGAGRNRRRRYHPLLQRAAGRGPRGRLLPGESASGKQLRLSTASRPMPGRQLV